MRIPTAAAATAVLLLCLGSSGCSKTAGTEPGTPVPGAIQKREATRVRVRPVEQREMVRRLSTTTEVRSEQEVQVFPLASGVVTAIRVEEGDRVEAGEVLAALDQREAALAVEDAAIALQEARQAIEKAALAIREAEGRADAQRLLHETTARKYQRNFNARLISEQDLEQLENERDTALRNFENAKLEVERAGFEHRAAQTNVERARLTHERALVALSHTEIRAPFEGVIAERSIYVGDNAGPGAPAFRLTDDRHLQAIIYRPQRELALFADTRQVANGPAGRGIEIQASAEALPGRSFRGEIRRISPGIDPASGAFRVTVALEDAADGARLLPGMLVRLEIIVERHPDALVVPKRALRREGETTILFRVEGRLVQRVIVDEGFSEGERVEVLPRAGNELAAGDAIVVIGNRDLEPGEEVEIEPWPGEADEAGEPEEADKSDEASEATAADDDDSHSAR